jgi:pimeloyl-ACP methyl ester carboxylesterase
MMSSVRIDDSETRILSVTIPAGRGIELAGDLSIPARATGIVLFAHGSGSSRHSSRNRFVASELNRANLATLLVDLLTEEEEYAERYSRHLRFDIELLARRLLAATDWAAAEPSTRHLPVGFFGASTGGGAALVAAAARPAKIAAVVSRGGRPDLAGEALPLVTAPTLLIVGGDDDVVIDLNEKALARLRCEKRLEIVPGATHLFEEPGTLERVAELARDWFTSHLG